MGLVDYSESESSGSEAEVPTKTPQKSSAPNSKKPFQKVVDRSNPGKIVVNLPQSTADAGKPEGDEPPAKRARTAAGGNFSGFNSFLPPPKNTGKPTTTSVNRKPRPGVNLKTSAEPGFSRDSEEGDGATNVSSAGMGLPPPKKQPQPSIPEDQKPAEDVKLVGKPLMFRPLSVARKPTKNKGAKRGTADLGGAGASSFASVQTKSNGTEAKDDPAPAPKPKVSLFSMHTEEPSLPTGPTKANGAYEPLFETEEPTEGDPTGDYAEYANYAQPGPAAMTGPATESLDTIADDLNLSAAARRELFGRSGISQGAKRVVNLNMDKEYQHNEELRAAGEQEIHNPVRAMQGGKHSLKKLVQNVHNQREALEDSFAKGKNNRKEATSRYGW